MSEFMHTVEQCPACGETRCTPNRDALRESHAELLAAAKESHAVMKSYVAIDGYAWVNAKVALRAAIERAEARNE